MFPNVVNSNQAPAVQGDFASTNPFASVLSGAGQLVAPAGGLVVGRFAWVGPAGQVSQSYVAGYQIGFLGRNEQALITNFLGESSLVVPAGFPVTLFNSGDFWAKFRAGATPGQNVYADPNDGDPIAAASTPSAASATASAGFTGTGTVVNASAVLTINTATAGLLQAGDTVSGTSIPSGTTILAQLTVAAGYGYGSRGTYQMSAAATGSAGPEAITSTSNILVVTAVASGSLNQGDVISGTGVTSGTAIVVQALPVFSGVATIATNTSLTVTSVTPGTAPLKIGDTVTGTGIPASTTISSQTSGTPGGVGVYVLSGATTASAAGVAITTTDAAGQTGLYTVNDAQNFASTTVTVAGTAQATGFKVRGTYTAGNNELAKISTN